MKGMATCKVCGRDFPLIFEEHKVVRDSGKKANLMGALTLQDEEALWDAYDCPYCGCQNVMQERKIEFCEPDDDYSEVSPAIHDGCAGCVYEDCGCEDEPCTGCKHNHPDKYIPNPKGEKS